MAQDLGLRIRVNKTEAERELEEFLAKWESRPVKLNVSLNDAGLKAASAEIQKLKQEALNAQKAIEKGATSSGSKTGSGSSFLSKQIKSQQKEAQALGSLWLKLEKKKNSLQKSLNVAQKNPQFTTSAIANYQREIDSLKTQMKQVADLRNALQTKTANGKSSDALLGDVDRIKTNSAVKLQNAKESIEYLNNLNATYKTTQKEIADAQKAIEKGNNKVIAFDKVGNRLTEYWGKYGTQLQRNIPLLEKYQTLVNRVNTRDFGSTSELNQAFAQFRIEARQAGVEVESFGSKLERTFGSRVRSAMAGYGVFAMQSAMQDIIANSVKIDTSLTELKKVTDASDKEYADFMNNASVRAKQIGASLNDVVSATADYARLGLTTVPLYGDI